MLRTPRIAVAPFQRGVALAVGLVLLVVMTLMVLAGVRLSTLELRMSLNDEIQVNAFEQAQSLVDTVIRDFSNTPVLGDDVVLCLNTAFNTTYGGKCTGSDTLLLPADAAPYFSKTDTTLNVLITRVPPQSAPPPVGSGFSADKFASAQMRVWGTFDRNADGQGKAEVREGLAIVYSAPSEIPTFSDAGS